MKQKTRNKLLAWVLTAAMILSMLPVAAFAASEGDNVTIHQVTQEEDSNNTYGEDYAVGTIIAVTSGDPMTVTELEGEAPNWTYTASGENLTIERIADNHFSISGTIGTLTLDDTSAQITNVTLTNGSKVGTLAVMNQISNKLVVAAGAAVTIDGVAFTAGGSNMEVTKTADGPIVLSSAPAGTVSLAANSKVRVDGWIYTAKAAADMTFGNPHTVVSGSVSAAYNTSNFSTGNWDVHSNATLTVDGFAITAAADAADGKIAVKATTGGENAITVDGNVSQLTLAGTSTSGKITVNGDVDNYRQVSVTGAPTVTITDALNSGYICANDNVTGIAPTINAASLTGTITTGGATNSTATVQIGTDSDAGHFHVRLDIGGNRHPVISFDSTGNTMTFGGDSGTVTNLDTTGPLTYNLKMTTEGGTFDTAGQSISGKVTFANAVAKNYPKDGSLTTAIPTVTDGGTPTYADTDNTALITGGVVFEDNAAGYVDGIMHARTGKGIVIGANAYAAFSYVRLGQDLYNPTDDANTLTSIGSGATVNLTAGRGYGNGSVGLLDGSAVTLVGEGNSATFLMGKRTMLNTEIITPAKSNIDIIYYDGGTTSQKITVGSAAKLTLSGGGSDKKLNLEQGEGDIVLENGIPTTDRTTITFNWCDADSVDAGTPNFENLCLKKGNLTEIIVSNTDLDGVVIGKPDANGGEGSGSNEGSGNYLAGSKGSSTDGQVTETISGHTNTFKVGEEVIAVLDDAAGNGTVTITVNSDSPYRIISITEGASEADPDAVEHLTDGSTVDPGQTFTLTKVGGRYITVTFATTAQTEGGGAVISDSIVRFNDDAATDHYNHFVVANNDSMEIYLGANSSISANSTFDLGYGSTLTIHGQGADSASCQMKAQIQIDNSNTTIILNNVNWDASTAPANDYGALRVDQNVTGAKLIVNGDSRIAGPNGADNTADETDSISATKANHSQSAGIRNAGQLTIEVAEGKTLAITGGHGVDATTPSANGLYYGGAGVYNTATADLTFTGAGVITITGGAGSAGYSWPQAANENEGDGGTGHAAGYGLYNGGSVTVAMDSQTWVEGQLVITGGTGGAGGNGGTKPVPNHSNSDVGYDAGQGGAGAAAVIAGEKFTVNSGVFLSYAGQGGDGGTGGQPYCQSHSPAPTFYGTRGASYGRASSAAYAIEGTSITINGGTTYAFGATNGGKLTGMVVNGGTIYGGTLTSVGYDNETSVVSTDMVPTITGTGFTDGSAITPVTTSTPVTTTGGGQTDQVYFTRIKTGTEGAKYLVKGMEFTLNSAAPDTHYTYQGADTGMYANEQGFLYVYLPDDVDISDGKAKAVLTLQQDGTNAMFRMTCGGAGARDGINKYGFGDIYKHNEVTKSQINYDGNSVWGEAFLLGGQTYYNGVDLTLAKGYATWGSSGAPQQSPVYNATAGTWATKGAKIDQPYQLATLAFAVNHYDDVLGLSQFVWNDGGGIADFGISADLNMGQMLWTPIGDRADHPFSGQIMGTKGQGYYTGAETQIKGLRMPAGYAGTAFGLFGYVKDADVSYLTVNDDQLNGVPYAKTLPTSSYDEAVNTTSGGAYAWGEDELTWAGNTTYLGGIAGYADNSDIAHCRIRGLTVDSKGTPYGGGIAGYANDTLISQCQVHVLTAGLGQELVPTAEGDEVANPETAYLGGLVGYARNTDILAGADSCDSITLTGVATDNAYLGGVAGYLTGGSVTGNSIFLAAGDGGLYSLMLKSNAGDQAWAGGIAGYAGNAAISAQTTTDENILHDMSIEAAGKTAAYAGGVTGQSSGVTFDRISVYANSDSAHNYIAATAPDAAYAGGLTGHSTNDLVRDVEVRADDHNAWFRIATGVFANNYAGGFAGSADGTQFYRSFVREVGMSGNSYVSLIGIAHNTQMYGCYAQGVTDGASGAPDYAFNTVSGSGSKYVGCYSTTANWASRDGGITGYFNCYYVNDTGAETPASNDGLKKVIATALQSGGGGAAIAAMNSELMKTEGAETNGNDSGFDYTASYGKPICYTSDGPATAANNSYAVFGDMVTLSVTVSEGEDYLAEEDWITVTPASSAVVGADGAYWVLSGTTVTITLKKADGVTISSATYTVNGTGGGSINTPNDSLATNAATVAVTENTIVDFKLTPQTFYRYKVNLKDSNDGEEGAGSGTGVTVTLSNSTVVKQSATSSDFMDPQDMSTTDKSIHNIILTATNGTLTVPVTPEGWTEVDVASGNYKQYSCTAGTSAAEVQAFVRQVQVSYSVSSSNSPVRGEVNLLVSEWGARGDTLKSHYYNGHYYTAEAASATWAQADAIVRSGRSLLGGMNGSLAVIDSADENAYVAGLNSGTGWIAANDAAKEGAFVNAIPNGYIWGNDLNYADWQRGEPNNYGGGEDYAAINYLGAGKWNDYSSTQALSVMFQEYGGVTTENASGGSDAYGYTLTYQYSGGTGGGSSQPTSPDENGISVLLNTEEHNLYLAGYPDGTFQPNANMTRAEVAQMFYALLKNKNVSGGKSFADVNSGDWFAPAVNALSALGVVTGRDSGLFEPDDQITRAEFVTVAMNFVDKVYDGTKTFTDVTEGHWAYDSIIAATGFGWITGYSDGSFRPDGDITRAEAAVIVNNMIGRAADQDYVDAHLSALNSFPDVTKDHWAYYAIMEAANTHDYTRDTTSGVESWK